MRRLAIKRILLEGPQHNNYLHFRIKRLLIRAKRQFPLFLNQFQMHQTECCLFMELLQAVSRLTSGLYPGCSFFSLIAPSF